MGTKKILKITLCAASLFIWNGVMAQDYEQRAQHTTDRMKRELNLTDKQYTKLYKLNLKWAKEDDQKREQGAQRPGGMGMMPGMPPQGAPQGMPPQGMRSQGAPQGMGPGMQPQGFGRPQGDAPDFEQMDAQRQRRDKKLKKILTQEQFNKWSDISRPALPEINLE